MGDSTNLNIRLIIIAVLLFGILSTPTPADITFVDDDAPLGGNGSTWPSAYKHLQDALSTARYGDDIRVAQGTYKPDQDEAGNVVPGDRSAAFLLKSGVAIYGGYAGIGTPDPNDRNRDIYIATLNGDLAGNDGPDFANNDENCYNVVKTIETDANAILDGFTVTCGNADGYFYDHFGGGLLVLSGNPTLNNCIFINNYAFCGGAVCNYYYSSATWTNCAFINNLAEAGGGMYNVDSEPNVTNCTFSGNTASYEFTYEGEGGGMYNQSCSPTVVDCTFIGNSADMEGGGMYNSGFDSPKVINCTFKQNFAESMGGGVYNWFCDLILTDCKFIENRSKDGGGIYNKNNSNPVITNCIFSSNSVVFFGGGMSNKESGPFVANCLFSGNSAGYSGGGMYNNDSNPALTNCTFKGNPAGDSGGAMFNYGTSLALTNSIFSGNSAADDGGGIHNYDSSMVIANCEFAGNAADDEGGAVYYGYASSLGTVTNCTFSGNSANRGGGFRNRFSSAVLTNCILWGNTAVSNPQIFTDGSEAPVIHHSDIQGGWQGNNGWQGYSNIDVDPMFVDQGYWDPNGTPENPNDDFWVDGDYHLDWLSPCRNVGDPNYNKTGRTDIDGQPRIRYGRVDMGADEVFSLGCDFEPDGDVDLADFATFSASWELNDCNEPADFDESCLVDIADVAIFAGRWLARTEKAMKIGLTPDNLWMYQNLPGATNSNIIASVSITDDPLGNNSYTYDWEFILPEDVTVAPTTTDDDQAGESFCTFAAQNCNEPAGLSDSGQPFAVKVTVTGYDYGNSATAEAQFGIALLGDVNNDTFVNVDDRGIINDFLQTGSAGDFTLRDCDLNCDGYVNVADRGIVNAIRQGALGQNSVSSPCPLRNDIVLIPGGKFDMGEHHDVGSSYERPVHAVYLDSFYMSKYEITNQQYCDYLNSTMSLNEIKVDGGIVYSSSDPCNSYPYFETYSADPDSQITYSEGTFSVRIRDANDMADHPVVEVSWYGAGAYCNWRSQQEGYQQCYDLSVWEFDLSKNGYRLPTEAEWEYAARGACHEPYYKYPWCDNSINCSKANYYRCNPCGLSDYPFTCPVGSYSANNYGLCDMAGNVNEWCNDWYGSSYYILSLSGNPTGPDSGTSRIVRGGDWFNSEFNCRVAKRWWLTPDVGTSGYGFRLVLDLN